MTFASALVHTVTQYISMAVPSQCLVIVIAFVLQTLFEVHAKKRLQPQKLVKQFDEFEQNSETAPLNQDVLGAESLRESDDAAEPWSNTTSEAQTAGVDVPE